VVVGRRVEVTLYMTVDAPPRLPQTCFDCLSMLIDSDIVCIARKCLPVDCVGLQAAVGLIWAMIDIELALAMPVLLAVHTLAIGKAVIGRQVYRFTIKVYKRFTIKVYISRFTIKVYRFTRLVYSQPTLPLVRSHLFFIQWHGLPSLQFYLVISRPLDDKPETTHGKLGIDAG
jgi:hypothetical protein